MCMDFAVLLAAGSVGAPWVFRMFIETRGEILDGTLPYFSYQYLYDGLPGDSRTHFAVSSAFEYQKRRCVSAGECQVSEEGFPGAA